MVEILDAYGRPIVKAALKQEQAAPTSGSIRRPRQHDEATDLTPVRLARLLKASLSGDVEAYLALAEDMEERDLHYAGVLSSRKLQVAGLEVTVDAAGDSAEEVADADMIRAFVERDTFETELFDILDATGKGFSRTEIIWDTSESQWEPTELKWRDPRWFRPDPIDGETMLLREPGGDVPLAPYKWIAHQGKVKSGLPIRGGLARAVCWTYLFKSFSAKDWAIFVEAYGQPMRLGKWGEGASEEEKQVLLDAVLNIGTDYAAVVPEKMIIELIEAKVAGNIDLYERRCDWLDRQVSKVVLGQTGTTDGIEGGGYAQAKVHDGVKADIERSDAKQLAASLNRDLVRPYISLNKGPRKAYPRIRIGRAEEVDLEKWMGNVKTFVTLGGKVGMTMVADKLGIPDPGKDEELLRAGSPEPAGQPEDKPGEKPAEKPALPTAQRSAHRVAPQPGRDAVDISVDQMLGDDGWEPLVSPMIAGLADKIAGAGTPEVARQALADHFASMDVDQLAGLLARAVFNARLAGEYDEDLGG